MQKSFWLFLLMKRISFYLQIKWNSLSVFLTIFNFDMVSIIQKYFMRIYVFELHSISIEMPSNQVKICRLVAFSISMNMNILYK